MFWNKLMRQTRLTSTKVTERPKCRERKDLLKSRNTWAHRLSKQGRANVMVWAWRADHLIFCLSLFIVFSIRLPSVCQGEDIESRKMVMSDCPVQMLSVSVLILFLMSSQSLFSSESQTQRSFSKYMAGIKMGFMKLCAKCFPLFISEN